MPTRQEQRSAWNKEARDLREQSSDDLKQQWEENLKDLHKNKKHKKLRRRSMHVDPRLQGRIILRSDLKRLTADGDPAPFSLLQKLSDDGCGCDENQSMQSRRPMSQISTRQEPIAAPCLSLSRVRIELPTIERMGPVGLVTDWHAKIYADADSLATAIDEFTFEFEGTIAHPDRLIYDGDGGGLCGGSCADWLLHFSCHVSALEGTAFYLDTLHEEFSSIGCPGVLPQPNPIQLGVDPPHAIQDVPVAIIVVDSAGNKAMLLFKFVVKSWC